MDQLKEQIISRIRACLVSTKGKLTLRQLENDYRTLMGERIPYQKLGYSNLEQFLKSVQTLSITKGPNGELLIDAKKTEQTAHIQEMVRKQKQSKKKKVARFSPVSNRRNKNSKLPPRWRPTSVKTTNSQQQYQQQQRDKPKQQQQKAINTNILQTQIRPAIKAHNQIVNSPKRVIFSDSNNIEMEQTDDQDNNNKENIIKNDIYKTINDRSPYLSTKRRISEIMARLDLERDSGNSSPTQDAVKPGTQEFLPTGKPIEDLKEFAKFYDLGNVETSFHPIKLQKKVYTSCKIKIGAQVFSSYPDADFLDTKAAELFAASKALNTLMSKYGRRKSLLISSNEDILARIPPMLSKHSNALWAAQLESDYTDFYNEQLPADWLKVVDSSQVVRIEKCNGGYVLQYCRPGEVLQKGMKWDINLPLYDISIPCNTVDFDITEEGRITALITTAISTQEIWCQQIGTETYSAFINLVEAMNEYYEKHKFLTNIKAVQINVNSCYIIKHDGCWTRIRVINICDDKVDYFNCFALDFGDEIEVHKDNIYLLKREFASIQAQAFVCRLVGLEELYEFSKTSEKFLDIVSSEVILEFANYGYNDDLAVPVVAYNIETNESMNEKLITELTLESASQHLEKKTINEVYITHVADNGDVYVQRHNSGYRHLDELLNNLVITIQQNDLRHLLEDITKNNSIGRLYLTLNKLNNKWCRAIILDWSPISEGLVQIYFIDYGNDYVINIKNEILYPLDQLSDIVNKYPPQAVKVNLLIESLPNNFVDMVLKLMPKEQSVLLKVADIDINNVPKVEFFKRGHDGNLLCINKAIDMEVELINKKEEKDTVKKGILNMVKYNETKNVPSGGRLKRPSIPSSNEFFNVKIPFAVNPWNFIVQPLSSLPALRKMMLTMQEKYRFNTREPLTIDEVIPGNIYATKYEDDQWYRISVLKVIHTGSISVYFCDFGYYTNLTLPQLVRLDSEFLELPYQALKAKLSGIAPVQNKWTVQDCATFKQMVSDKSFSSVIQDIERDELYKSDLVLKLTLIDTSTDVDVKIHESLINKGIAIHL